MIWLYISELAGKDLEISVIGKFILYACNLRTEVHPREDGSVGFNLSSGRIQEYTLRGIKT